MSAGDGHILDRLYLDESAALAMSWLWENMRNLRSDLGCPVGAANYAAMHAAKRLMLEDDSTQMTADDASFLAQAQEFCEANGHQFIHLSQGARLNPTIVAALWAIAKKLLDEWLLNQNT